MENNKYCIFCKENMIYGLQTQIICKTIKKEDKYIRKIIKYVQYGWRCPMKDDCDIVFDEKDTDKNNLIYEEANKQLYN